MQQGLADSNFLIHKHDLAQAFEPHQTDARTPSTASSCTSHHKPGIPPTSRNSVSIRVMTPGTTLPSPVTTIFPASSVRRSSGNFTNTSKIKDTIESSSP
ncbi:hypothetical protein BCR33DRAFT_370909 [Rhizoclosmatium globosum]|uniref:Uncharacterized protein n=1 Tax=Rhizoclosmatium globosum TaxID=329046 RepID=A0A1Y2BZJ0_9FUNG|nr:hypothetical protein BCR33DRAFT_370909 [Rhizoclosmatium globosum]|eukprot:ORY40146.1 hypothetical protein BCR33DRAFT_370909 [Rhizoclosmatium globosum]